MGYVCSIERLSPKKATCYDLPPELDKAIGPPITREEWRKAVASQGGDLRLSWSDESDDDEDAEEEDPGDDDAPEDAKLWTGSSWLARFTYYDGRITFTPPVDPEEVPWVNHFLRELGAVVVGEESEIFHPIETTLLTEEARPLQPLRELPEDEDEDED